MPDKPGSPTTATETATETETGTETDDDRGTSDAEKATWKQTTGLAADTDVARVYVAERHKADFKEEARCDNYSSMSSYLYDLILEARGYRRYGFTVSAPVERLDELEAEVDALEERLEREREQHGGRTTIDDPAVITRFLSDEYRLLGDLMQRVIESGTLENIVRQRIEDQLYFLATQDRVAYEPGFGWKLTDDTYPDVHRQPETED
jgi:hypothetical protein